jgi:hypothetical protein
MKCASRRVHVILLAPCLFAAGCLIPYAYPKLSHTPSCDLKEQANDVHAFRVDVVSAKDLMTERADYTLAEIKPLPDGSIPSQTRVTLEHGLGVILKLGEIHAMRVRLYRPGYKLVELESWDSQDKISWIPAENWESQELAVDTLVSCPMLRHPTVPGPSRPHETLQPPTTPEAKQALVFAAGEYERVAKLAPTAEEANRIRAKAQKLVDPKPAATQLSSAAATAPN